VGRMTDRACLTVAVAFLIAAAAVALLWAAA
jgi:hypothetical protein